MSTDGFEMRLIADPEATGAHGILLDDFRKLYDDGFPDRNEREDFDSILTRIKCGKEVPRSSVVLCHAPGGQKVLGGLI